MSATLTNEQVVRFPRRYRRPLPRDAIPRGKSRHVWVFPWRGAWAWAEVDEEGGMSEDGLTKAAAINEALSFVFEFAATMEVRNADPDCGDPDGRGPW